jgi:2-octaprenyl-6-methoxyphenol hydroxylase
MSTNSPFERREIIIGGFGAAGCSLALALVKGGVSPAEILIFDSAPLAGEAPVGVDARILALNEGACALLGAVDVWKALAPHAHPLNSMSISDSPLDEPFRPALFGFEAAQDGQPLAQMVPLGLLNETLRAATKAAGIEVVSASLASLAPGREFSRVTVNGAEGARSVNARLVVACDGAASPIRTLAGISTHGWFYGQSGICATLRHSLPHGGEAVQHFLPAGPFALLPLDAHRSSIVWSEKTAFADEMLKADAGTFLREVEKRAAGVRGEIRDVECRSAHPLQLKLARSFIGPRLALVADSAHVVHPLAGQGLNLGFEDVAMLAELVVDQLRLGLDPGAPDALERYQARRRPAAMAMAVTTESINRLFSNDFGPIRLLRDVGMGLLNRIPGIKGALASAAAGRTPYAPRLFKGEPL